MVEERLDNFIGKRFGNNGHLTVISRGNKDTPAHKSYIVKCSICKADPELFGEGYFDILACNLQAGQIPCGCAKCPKWTEEQRLIQIDRVCKTNNWKFTGFVGNIYKGKDTNLDMYCPKHDKFWNTTRVGRLVKGKGCTECAKDKVRLDFTEIRVTKHIKNFSISCIYPESTVFKPLSPDLRVWELECPVCKEDSYSKIGNLPHTFRISFSNLISGKIPCRCCKTSRRSTADEREFKVREVLGEENSNLQFIGWSEEYSGNSSRFDLFCPIHGVQKTTVSSFLDVGKRCSGCTAKGYSVQEDGYLYVFRCSSEVGGFTGYGITNSPENRLKLHRRNLLNSGFLIEEISILGLDGKSVLDTETAIRHNFPKHSQTIDNFKREATYPELYYDVLNFAREKLKIYKEQNNASK